MEFIRKYIPSDVKITLIVHSIGSYIALQLFKVDDINERIQQCCLLFPTFEYMAATPSGKTYINILQFFFKPLHYGAMLLNLFPRFFRVFCVRIAFLIRRIPAQFVDEALLIIRPSILSKIVFMADCEMDDVLEPDYATIEKNKARLRFVYGATDGWTPVSYCERLRAHIPNVAAHLSDRFDHTFTLQTNYAEMAECLASWVQSPDNFLVEKLSK